MTTESRRQVLLALAGDERVLASLAPESPLARHLPAAQAAVEAFCRGDDAAMEAALAGLPFRSPYRDLRWLLKALACHPENPAAGRRFLARIAPDSPFHGPARIAEAVLAGETSALSPPFREFAAALRRPESPDKLTTVQRLIDRMDAETAKGLLVHVPSAMFLYQHRIAPLPPAERLRIEALHQERYGDCRRACELWGELLALHRETEPLQAAAIAEHLAELTADLAGLEDPQVARWLEAAAGLDPDDRAVWLKLADHYRRCGKNADLRKTLARALARFPDDGALRRLAAQAALERGACRQAAAHAKHLLRRDPLDEQARELLFQARVAQARKYLAAGREDLARRVLADAWEAAGDEGRRAQVLALEGMAALLGGCPSQADDCFHQARRLLAPPLADWRIAAEALLTRRPPSVTDALLKSLRLILAHAALNPDKSIMTALLDDAVELARSDPDAARLLLRTGSGYFPRMARLEWSLAEIDTLGERLLTLERYQWLRDLVRNHPGWRQRPPLLVYLDIAAKCRGVAENLNLHDVARLSRALEQVGEDQPRLRGRIEGLLADFQAAFSRPAPFGSRGDAPALSPEGGMETAVKAVAAWLDPRRWVS